VILISVFKIIAALTREHGGWEQAAGLITADARSRVKCLVPARSDGARHLTKSGPRFPATKSPGTLSISGGAKRRPLHAVGRPGI